MTNTQYRLCNQDYICINEPLINNFAVKLSRVPLLKKKRKRRFTRVSKATVYHYAKQGKIRKMAHPHRFNRSYDSLLLLKFNV